MRTGSHASMLTGPSKKSREMASIDWSARGYVELRVAFAIAEKPLKKHRVMRVSDVKIMLLGSCYISY
jgi:hypothetical protein